MSDLAQLLFSVPPEVVEAVSNFLVEEVGPGIEQRDDETLQKAAAGSAELLVWVPASDITRRVEQVTLFLESLEKTGLKTSPWSWRSEDAAPEKWLDAYKRFFKVTRLARFTVVKPSWDDWTPEPQDLVVELDPGQAFGTGLHASTRLAVCALERIARFGPDPDSALDVGCGTGILAIVMAKLWPHCQIVAVDRDETAAQVAQANVERNNVAKQVRVEHRHAEDLEGCYGLIAANLTHEALEKLHPLWPQHLDDFGRIVLSGLLAPQADEIALRYARDLQFEPEYTEEENGWRSLLLRMRG